MLSKSPFVRAASRQLCNRTPLHATGVRWFNCSTSLLNASPGNKPKQNPRFEIFFERKQPGQNPKGNPGNEPPKIPGGSWQPFVFGFLGTSLITMYMFSNALNGPEMSWEEFRRTYIDPGLVDRIEVVNRSYARALVRGSDGARKIVHFSIGSVDAFDRHLDETENSLQKADQDRVPVSYVDEVSYLSVLGSLLPTVLLIGGMYYLMKRSLSGAGGGGSSGAGGIFSAGKSKAKKFNVETDVKIKFADVAGADEAKEEIMEFVKFLKEPAKYEKLGAKIPKGALLTGPPGTGKTLLAKATAGEAGVPFYSVSGSEFVEMFVGVGASRVRDLFNTARKDAPSIIFVDEIDAIGRSRMGSGGGFGGGGNDERESTLNQLLVEMDGFSSSEYVVVLAATNRADVLDPALLRPGRFDRRVNVDQPDVKGRLAIYKIYLPKIKLSPQAGNLEDLAGRLAALTPGFVGADIANCVNEAALIAARHDCPAVEVKHFEEAIERVTSGLENKSKILPPDERKTTAYHEAGHAVCSWFLEHANPFLKVTIIPRGQALGYARYLPSDTQLPNRSELEDQMVMALGGRVSEELHFPTVSSGAQSDFKQVTDIATRMVTSWGMSEKIGWLNFHEDGTYYTKPFSEETAMIIDQEVRRIVEQAHTQCRSLLQEHKHQVELLAEELLKREVLDRRDVERLLGPRPFPEVNDEFKYLEGSEPSTGSA